MTLLTREDALRIARLARLELAPAEVERLAPALEAITREFASLAEYAERLAPPPEPAASALREDQVEPAAREVVEGILRAAPRVDPATGAVLVKRGAP